MAALRASKNSRMGIFQNTFFFFTIVQKMQMLDPTAPHKDVPKSEHGITVPSLRTLKLVQTISKDNGLGNSYPSWRVQWVKFM